MKNEDTRVQFTKARFHDAIIELLEQKPIGFVTIKELCDTAGLNRGTFYLHYAEPIDVLREMEWALFDRIMVFKRGEQETLEQGFLRQIAAIEKERRLCSVVIGHNGDPQFLETVWEKAFSIVQDPMTGYGVDRERELFVFDFLFSAVTGSITAWLGGKLPFSGEELAKMLARNCVSILNNNQ